MTFLKKIATKLDSTDKSGIKNMVIKPIGMVLSVVYTPLLLSYLGDEKYGLWATIMSIISWVNYCDVGIGHGLRNLLTKELTDKKYDSARRSVSTAYILLTAISAILLMLLLASMIFLDWRQLLNTELKIEVPIFISFVFIIINFILALSNTMLYALQLSEKVALRGCLVQILNIIGLIALKQFTESSLVWMAILFGITTMIVYVGNSIQIFNKQKYLRPGIRYFDRNRISAIGSIGIKFFAIQLSRILLYTVDSLLITHYFGAVEVTPFHVADKAFNTVCAFLTALVVPYWSKTTQKLHMGQIGWIQSALKKIHVISSIFFAGYVLMALILKPLTTVWMGRELAFQPGLIEVMCAYYILYSVVITHTPFINGTGKINGQLVLSIIMGAVNVPLSIWLGVNCGMGVMGIRLATTILMAVAAVFYPINLYMILKKYKTQEKLAPRNQED